MSIVFPLFKGKFLGYERDAVTISVKCRGFPLLSVAVVDTGCPFTILSEAALKRTRIPYNSSTECGVVSLGPIQLQLRELGVCQLSLRDENGRTVTFNQKIYAGLALTKGILAQELPSFIGKDFLENNLFSIKNRKEGSFLIKDD